MIGTQLCTRRKITLKDYLSESEWLVCYNILMKGKYGCKDITEKIHELARQHRVMAKEEYSETASSEICQPKKS